MDIKNALLYGYISRNVYIELPQEDPMSSSGKYVGKLVKTMYGTRDAPAAWQEEIESTMLELGLRACVSTHCLYYHPTLKIRVVIHVNDLLCIGDKENLGKFRRGSHEEVRAEAHVPWTRLFRRVASGP